MNITVHESIVIAAPPEKVWDFTQDWSRRKEWDDSVVSVEVVSQEPKELRVKWVGGLDTVIRYKQNERPKRTSLAMIGSNWLVTGGGGSWEYVAVAGGTEFKQTNTLSIKGGCLGFLFGALVRSQSQKAARAALAKAKKLIESSP